MEWAFLLTDFVLVHSTYSATNYAVPCLALPNPDAQLYGLALPLRFYGIEAPTLFSVSREGRSHHRQQMADLS